MSLNQAYSSGGSTNSSRSISNTAGNAASIIAQQQAAAANSTAQSAWQQTASYNAQQAAIQRAWQEQMANTVYQRTINDMKAAGINPVLAAGMGLGTASVGGASAANITPAQVYSAQTFPESNSTSESSGKSWNQSESGLLTALTAFGEAIKGAIGAISSSHTINVALDGIKQITETDEGTAGEKVMDVIDNIAGNERGTTRSFFTTQNSGRYKALKNTMSKPNSPYNYNNYKTPGRMNEASWGTK